MAGSLLYQRSAWSLTARNPTNFWFYICGFNINIAIIIMKQSRYLEKRLQDKKKKLMKSPFLKEWIMVGQVAVKPGIANGKAQIVIYPLPKGFDADKVNEDFFE